MPEPPTQDLPPWFFSLLSNIGRMTILQTLITPSNQYEKTEECIDGICMNVHSGGGYDLLTHQSLSMLEIFSRSSMPEISAGKNKSSNYGRGSQYNRDPYKQENYKNKITTPKSNPSKCAYCRNLAPGTMEHIIALKNWDDLNKNNVLTFEEAKSGLDAMENLVRACFSCNSSKKNKRLGTEWSPKNPNEYIKWLINLNMSPTTDF